MHVKYDNSTTDSIWRVEIVDGVGDVTEAGPPVGILTSTFPSTGVLYRPSHYKDLRLVSSTHTL